MAVPAKVWRQPQVMHSQAAGGGSVVLAYHARYTLCIALSNKRLLRDGDGRVTFGCTESGTGEDRTLTLDANEFIRHFLAPRSAGRAAQGALWSLS